VKQQAWKARITTAHKKPLPKSVGKNGVLTISGTHNVYESVEEVQKAYGKPGEFDKFVTESATAADKATTVAAARTAALKDAGIEAPKMAESRELQIRSVMAGLTASGMPEDAARKVAEDLIPQKAEGEESEDTDEGEPE
jgi:hypothetical protein